MIGQSTQAAAGLEDALLCSGSGGSGRLSDVSIADPSGSSDSDICDVVPDPAGRWNNGRDGRAIPSFPCSHVAGFVLGGSSGLSANRGPGLTPRIFSCCFRDTATAARFAFCCGLGVCLTSSLMPLGTAFWSEQSRTGYTRLFVPGPRAEHFPKCLSSCRLQLALHQPTTSILD